MRFWNKYIYSWLLVLVMATSPVQGTMAFDVDQDAHGDRCQMTSIPSHDSVDINFPHNCPMGHGDQCKDHPGCVGQINLTSLQAPFSSQFASRTSSRFKFTRQTDDIQTIYPSLLKRPPKD